MPKTTKPKVVKPVKMDTTPAAPAETPKVTPNPEGNIDERMAALLEDHQKMGARPK